MGKNIEARQNWIPNKKGSDGARMYHNAVIKANWNLSNLEMLAEKFNSIEGKKEIIVDFGAGTGASSVYLKDYISESSELWLTDNSPSWLTIAYELLGSYENVKFYTLGKQGDVYDTLADVIGEDIADVVVSANTFHLIPALDAAMSGIYKALNIGGHFIFQSGNIISEDRDKDLLMIDSTVEEIHSIAIDIIRNDSQFEEYKEDLDERIATELVQRKMIFPTPRPVSEYVRAMKNSGFKNINISWKNIFVKYDEWRDFLNVNRIQAGILPEIGGRFPTDKELEDRNAIISLAIDRYFKKLQECNAFADQNGFMAQWVYFEGEKLL